jgi:hypothetical protein
MQSRLSRLGSVTVILIIATSSLLPASAAPTMATHKVLLPVVANYATPLTSEQLIDAALARGEISAETAIVYKVYVVFGDSRLPARFHGDDRTATDGDSVKTAMAQFSSLSPSAQAILAPYLIPPIYEGSWEDPTPATAVRFAADLTCKDVTPDTWQYVDGAYCRVWWKKSRPGDRTAAVAYKNAIETTIWPRLTQLMGQEPLSDLSFSCNGGKGTLDIYVDDTVTRSYEQGFGCEKTAGYIVLRVGADNRTLAHEFMHAIQDAYDVHSGCVYGPEYAWLCEATANWAQYWLYPDAALERQSADRLFQPNTDPPPLERKDGSHEYGAFLFFYFLTHYFSNDGLIRGVWDNTESYNGLEAVDRSIPGGFAAVWDKFAVYNWDQPPYDQYKRWSGLTLTPETYLGRHPAITGPTEEWVLLRRLSHLAVAYHHYTFSGEEPRLVTFFNGFLYKITPEPLKLPTLPGLRTLDDGTVQLKFERAPDSETKGAKVQVLFKIEGDSQWKLKDMTDLPYLSWCRDAKSERLEEMVIIYSNSEYSPKTYRAGSTDGQISKLLVSDVGCYQYIGNATALYGDSEPGYVSIEDVQQVSNVVWERTAAYPDIPYPYIAFRAVSGHWARTYTMTGMCSGQATDSDSLSQEDANFLYLLYGLQGGTDRSYTGEGNLARITPFTANCTDGDPLVVDPPSLWWFVVDNLTLLNERAYKADASGVLEGKGEHYTGEEWPLFDWHFAPQREN